LKKNRMALKGKSNMVTELLGYWVIKSSGFLGLLSLLGLCGFSGLFSFSRLFCLSRFSVMTVTFTEIGNKV
jgi:hypothetical protein